MQRKSRIIELLTSFSVVKGDYLFSQNDQTKIIIFIDIHSKNFKLNTLHCESYNCCSSYRGSAFGYACSTLQPRNVPRGF